MSFIDKTKDFFGLGPVDIEEDDAYYNEEPRYSENSSSAYAPRRAPQSYEPAPVQEEFVPTIVAISLTSFNDAAKVGEPFRDGDAVVFELTDAEKATAKRFIDFAAGLCFGLRAVCSTSPRAWTLSARSFPSCLSLQTLQSTNSSVPQACAKAARFI